MDRRVPLLELRRRIDVAAKSSQWTALADADRDMASALPALAAQGAWSAPERRALDVLRETHATARLLCAEELKVVGQRLREMASNKEGWLAYADEGQWQPSSFQGGTA
ncbi:MAG: hypothetical protein JWP52_1329 [Rhizobacter sp.]|nr:hypothetical protein [Rhizobacter sp.]